MRSLSPVQAFACATRLYDATMRWFASLLLILLLVPGWTGSERLALLGKRISIRAERVSLDPSDPERTRIGALAFLGGISLTSDDPAFGGFSSLSVQGDRFTLLSDGGNIVRFSMGGDWRIRRPGFANLPSGPGNGWQKKDRDSESMAIDAATGQIWVGFERANEIWRYGRDFIRAERHVAPAAIAEWPDNGGAESLVRYPDGSFIVIGETARPEHGRGRDALVFSSDPTLGSKPAFHFIYQPPKGYDPSDATALPDGRLLVLNRAFGLPFTFSSRLEIVDPRAIRPGARVRGRAIAMLASPLIHDNFEGVAVTREGAATIVWLVSDDNQLVLQRSLLLKFRLDETAPARSSGEKRAGTSARH